MPFKKKVYPTELLNKLGKYSDYVLADEYNLSRGNISRIRKIYNIKAFGYKHITKPLSDYPKEMIDLLGTVWDSDLSIRFNYPDYTIMRLRRRLHIPSYKAKKTYICPICGINFDKWISKRDIEERSGTFYCSAECRIKSRITGKILNCEYCDKQIYVIKCNLDKYKHHFCSRECGFKYKANIYGNGYGIGWSKQATLCLDRDKICKSCGENKNLHVHHIVPSIISKDNSLDNLILLCSKCHIKLETMYREIEERPRYWNNINSMKIGVN